MSIRFLLLIFISLILFGVFWGKKNERNAAEDSKISAKVEGGPFFGRLMAGAGVKMVSRFAIL